MPESVTDWLESLGLGQYSSAFRENAIDWDVLPEIDQQTLKDIGITRAGERLRLIKAAREKLATGNARSPDPQAVPAERRQLTVMFCDLVDSIALSQSLDAEALRELMQTYQRACGQVIAKYDGHVAQYLGDGLMTYFGWPRIHEDGAERAIRAGLEIIDALHQLHSPKPLQVRVGIATGEVVVGETGDGDASVPKLAVGQTPNLAARIQGLAQAGQIVISPDTRHLVGSSFTLVDLGEQRLKGIVESVHAWRVTGLAEVDGRFDAARIRAELSPVVGRDEELDILLRRFQIARENEGQVVLLSGEPGIGKSRLVAALRENLEHQNVNAMRFQCSPYYTNSPYWPCIDNLRRALRFAPKESAVARLDKLEAFIVNQCGRPLSDVRFIAAMLSIPCEERYRAVTIPPQKLKDEIHRTLVDITEVTARQQASVLLFEDAHWADPSTLEVMDLMIDRVRTMPLLILITHRPEFENRWAAHGHVTGLAIARLNRAQSAILISQAANGKALPGDLLEQILTKTDGVPLFIEELTRAILESGELTDRGDHYEYSGNEHQASVPATLRDSLMSRLDRYQPVREIAQIGAVIGREFSHQLISAVTPALPSDVDLALSQLIDSGLAFRRGTPPDAIYTFKHALVRDAAYDSLLKSRRVMIHDALFNRLAQMDGAAPETLAHHAKEAGRLAEASHYWERAGDQALQRTAYSEASYYFEQAALAAERSGDDSPNKDRELTLRSKQLQALNARWGYIHPATIAVIELALDLLDIVGATPHRLPILSLAAMRYAVGADFDKSLKITKALVAEADQTGNAIQQSLAYLVRGSSWGALGKFAAAEADFEKSLARYKPEHDLVVKGRAQMHIGTIRQCHWAKCLVLRGEIQRARGMLNGLDESVRILAHPPTQVTAHFWLAFLHLLLKLPDRDQQLQQALHLANEYQVHSAQRGMFITMALAQNDDDKHAEAVQTLENRIGLKPEPEANRPIGFLFGLYYAAYAASLAGVGRLHEARQVEGQVIAMLEAEPRNWAAAEAYRLLAVSHYQHRNEVSRAIEGMKRSLAIAQDQGAGLWRLRTTLSLARLRADLGERAAAMDLLRPVIDQFPAEEIEAGDLTKARSFLKELHPEM